MAAVVGVVAMFVPGLGEVAMVLGAGLAADRLYQRARNGTLRADPEAVNDVLNIVGALLPGITKIGSLIIGTGLFLAFFSLLLHI